MKCDWYAATLPDTPENVVSYMENNIGGTLKSLNLACMAIQTVGSWITNMEMPT